MTEQVNRDKISILYQSGISNAMELTRRTGIPKSMVYRTISKLNAKISIMRERRSRKGRVIVKNDTISLVKLARNNRHMSIQEVDEQIQYHTVEYILPGDRETAPQEAGTHPKGCQANSVPRTEAYGQTCVLDKGK